MNQPFRALHVVLGVTLLFFIVLRSAGFAGVGTFKVAITQAKARAALIQKSIRTVLQLAAKARTTEAAAKAAQQAANAKSVAAAVGRTLDALRMAEAAEQKVDDLLKAAQKAADAAKAAERAPNAAQVAEMARVAEAEARQAMAKFEQAKKAAMEAEWAEAAVSPHSSLEPSSSSRIVGAAAYAGQSLVAALTAWGDAQKALIEKMKRTYQPKADVLVRLEQDLQTLLQDTKTLEASHAVDEKTINKIVNFQVRDSFTDLPDYAKLYELRDRGVPSPAPQFAVHATQTLEMLRDAVKAQKMSPRMTRLQENIIAKLDRVHRLFRRY